MDEWLETLVIERLDALGYDGVDVPDVEDNLDSVTIAQLTALLTKEIDAAVTMAANEDEDEDEEDDWTEEDEEDEEDEDEEEEDDVIPWAARAR